MSIIRPTWAEVDLSAIKANIQNTRSLLKAGTRLMAVVKANAYGHGMLEVARAVIEAGADYLAVASLDEAECLRREGINSPILVLGYTPGECAGPAVDDGIELTVFDRHSATAMGAQAALRGCRLGIHIKVDSGMNRIGFAPDEASLDDIAALCSLPGIELKAVFSHFSVSDIEDKSFSMQQLTVFNRFCDSLEEKGITVPMRHIANSAAIMDIPEAELDMVRAGIMIYGCYPSDEVHKGRINLKPAMRLMSQVVQVKTIAAGDTVSYGRTYKAGGPVVVATVPIGYADGYSRLLSNRIWASIKGQRAEQIGTICMDQCMFDVSSIEGVTQGDEVVLFGRPEDGITAEDIAERLGTINYEVLCKVSNRVPRTYLR